MAICLAMKFMPGPASAQVSGKVGLAGQYDSNAYNDTYGGGSLAGSASLDLSADFGLPLGGILLGADYSGGYCGYLSYLGISQTDHQAKALLWHPLGEDGFLGAGVSLSMLANAADRSAYNTGSLKAVAEAKAYPAGWLLLRMDGSWGGYKYFNLSRYNFDLLGLNGSATAFLSSRTTFRGFVSLKDYRFSPQPSDSQVPTRITNLSPGLRISQGMGGWLGMAVEFVYLDNQLDHNSDNYQPDTLLNEVNEYFDYRGSRALAKLSIITGPDSRLDLWSSHTVRDYSELQAMGLPSSQFASILSRQPTGEMRQDRETELGADFTAPLLQESQKLYLNLGASYDRNLSNDKLYDYGKLLFYGGITLNF